MHHETGKRLLTSGIRLVRANPVSTRILLTLTTFSLLSLPYVGLFPAIARLNFGIVAKSPTYNWLYATWGFGACLGGLAVGTIFVEWDKRRLIRLGFALFATSMTAFALAREPIGAFISASSWALRTSARRRRCSRCCKAVSTITNAAE